MDLVQRRVMPLILIPTLTKSVGYPVSIDEPRALECKRGINATHCDETQRTRREKRWNRRPTGYVPL